MPSQWTNSVMIASSLRQNDVVTSFWRNNNVIIAQCVRWPPFHSLMKFISRGLTKLHQPRLWFITGGYLVKRWFIPAAARARGQSNDLNREILASNLCNCHKEVINAPPVPSISRCIHIVYGHKNVWEYQWSNFIYNCMSTFLHYVRCKDALLDCSAPGGERCESLTWVDEIGRHFTDISKCIVKETVHISKLIEVLQRQKVIIGPVLAWYQTNIKPLPEQMKTEFTFIHWNLNVIVFFSSSFFKINCHHCLHRKLSISQLLLQPVTFPEMALPFQCLRHQISMC